MDRGLKTSELMQELKKCIDNFGDLYVYKEKNGDARPIYCINHYPNTDYVELI